MKCESLGGTGSLPTKDLVQLLGKLGLERVRTCVQSGNAVFQADSAHTARLPARIRAGLSRKLGVAPEVILLRLEDLASAIAANPYRKAENAPDLAALEKLRKDNERFALQGRVFYLHAWVRTQ